MSEATVCLFAAYLANAGLAPQTISVYMAAIRHLQISSGFKAPPRESWPHLYYTLRGINRVRAATQQSCTRLPITADILRQLCDVWSSGTLEDPYNARLLWAASCLGFFGFLRAGEFTAASSSTPPPIRLQDVSVDSRENPSMLKVFIRCAKTDPFGKGVDLFLGRSGLALCPVSAILNYISTRPAGEGPLLVLQDGRPLLKAVFVKKVRKALMAAGIDHNLYSGHSFRIGAATSAAAAGVPAHLIKTMGRWSSEAYHVYIRTPREALASVSVALANAPRHRAQSRDS